MRQFHALVSRLQRKAPPLLPVRARLAATEDADCMGYCQLERTAAGRPRRFHVVVYDGAPWSYLRLILLHEWAHALSWSEGRDFTEDHGPEWALAYSRLYQLAVEQ